jgi:hypothetical protein
MKRIADINGHINPGAAVRSIGIRGGDTLAERDAAEDKIAFDARTMIKNGWNADKERAYQANAKACGVGASLYGDWEKLIVALEKAELDAGSAVTREKQNRSVARGLETSQMPPPPDFSDIPPPSDDDIYFGNMK